MERVRLEPAAAFLMAVAMLTARITGSEGLGEQVA